MCTICIDLGLGKCRVDLGEQLAFLDMVASFHQQRLKLTRYLRAHIHRLLGREATGSGYEDLQVTLSDFRSLQGRFLSVTLAQKNPTASRNAQDDCANHQHS